VTRTEEDGIVLWINPGVISEDDPGCWVNLSPNSAQRLASKLSSALIASGIMRGRAHRQVVCGGGKKGYPTKEAARMAHSKVGFRVRVYPCLECRLFHVANADKGADRP